MEESAGEALLRARMLGGLSQVELAKRAGITQSVVSAYESGRRQPSLPALRSLIDAAGFDMTLELSEIPAPLLRLTGPLGRRVRRHRGALKAVATGHGAMNLAVFGSVARGEDRPDSDVDLLFDRPAGMGLGAFGALARALEQVIDAPVDLIPSAGLKPWVRERVEKELIAL